MKGSCVDKQKLNISLRVNQLRKEEMFDDRYTSLGTDEESQRK